MAYNIYQGNDLIAEKIEDKEHVVEGLTPNTDYTFSVSEVIGDTESEKATISVKTKPVKVDSVAVTPKTNNLDVGKTRQLNVEINPSNATNQEVAYISSDDDIATVSSSGLVTAVAEGTATITVTADGQSDTATVNVTEPDPEEGD